MPSDDLKERSAGLCLAPIAKNAVLGQGVNHHGLVPSCGRSFMKKREKKKEGELGR